MNDPNRPKLLERLSALILREPGDRGELTRVMRSAYQRNLLDADALSIIEGALTVSEMQVRDIMIPRAQVDFIDIHEPVEKFIPQIIATAHSRFPVIDQNRDDVIVILLAKDLLRHYAGEENSTCARCCARQCSCPRRSASTCCCASSAPAATTWRSWSTSTA